MTCHRSNKRINIRTIIPRHIIGPPLLPRTILMEKRVLVIIFLLLPSEIDSKGSDACTNGKCNTHRLMCDNGKLIQIYRAYYGFTRYEKTCTNYCQHAKVSIYGSCTKEFREDHYNELIQRCNKQQNCNFTTPVTSKGIPCSRNMYYYYYYYYYTFSRIYYNCTKANEEEKNKEPGGIESADTSGAQTLSPETGVDSADIPVIVGSVTGCFILVILLVIVILVVIKRRRVSRVIGNHLQHSASLSNTGYKTTGESCNHVTFTHDNSPSTRGIESDDYNHLHDARTNNSTDNANDYNHLRIAPGEDKQFSDDYNHLGDFTKNTHFDHNDVGDLRKKTHADYKPRGDVREKPDADYNHVGNIREKEIHEDYNNLEKESEV